MTSFERKRIALCVMTGFLESGNTETELSIGAEGGLSAPWKCNPIFHYSIRMQTEAKYQIPENEQPSLFRFPTSFDDSFEREYILWLGQAWADIDK